MPIQQEQVLLGARIPYILKRQLIEYCNIHGFKMNYIIIEAIKEKLMEFIEESQDIELAKKRLKKPQFISQKEFNKYLKKKDIKT